MCDKGACIYACLAPPTLPKRTSLGTRPGYAGCDFWAIDLDNAYVPGGPTGYYDAAGAQYAVIVGNPHPKRSVEVTISDDAGPLALDAHGAPIDTSPLPPQSSRVYDLPRRDVDGTTRGALAYHIRATLPVMTYQFNPLPDAKVFSNDASLLLPLGALHHWYIAVSREQTFDLLRGQLVVVGVESGETNVTITSMTRTLGAPEFGIPALEPGEEFTTTLGRLEVLSIETRGPGDDLTGTEVYADGRVAVFAGSEASNAPNTAHCRDDGLCAFDGVTACESPVDCLKFNTCCADHLEEQMLPVVSWGTALVAARSQPRGEAPDVWRIVAAEDDTTVTTRPEQIPPPTLKRGEFVDFESSEDFVVEANQPVFLGQFLAAQDAPGPNVTGKAGATDAKVGDPAFITVVPRELWAVDYVLTVPPNFESNYVTLTAPESAEVQIDGLPVPDGDWTVVGAEPFKTARLELSEGPHVLTGDAAFGVIAYGWGQYVSYGYAGGLDVVDLEYLVPTPKGPSTSPQGF